MKESEILEILENISLDLCLEAERENNYGDKTESISATVTMKYKDTVLSEVKDWVYI